MKIIATILACAALTATAVSAAGEGVRAQQGSQGRQLQDTDTFCAACSVCTALGDLCSFNDLKDLSCTSCATWEALGVVGLCDACTACDSLGDACDVDAIGDLACGFCPNDGTGAAAGVDTVCFSEVATVQVQDIGSVTMKDLKVGDKILTNSNKYETVYAFGHHHPSKPANFFQIHNEKAGQPLEVTADHLVFLQDKTAPVPAQTVQVGDVLRSGSSSTGSTVIKVTTVERKGIYAPLTTGGTLIVDGVAASSYIHLDRKQQSLLSDHDLIHLTLSPYRLLCSGVSGTFCDNRFHNKEDGMPHYASYGLGLLRWLMNSNGVIHTVGFSIILILTGTCQLLEGIFGASLAPLMVFLAATGFASAFQNNRSKAKAL